MSVTCVIVNWNSKYYVQRCLKSIEENALRVISQCIVIDSGSFDGTESMVRHEFPWVTFMQAKRNVGFAAANNLASKKANNRYILFLNPDTQVRPGCLGALSEAIESLPKAGIVGPKILNTDGTIQESCVQAYPTPWNEAIDSELLRRLFRRYRGWGNFRAFSRSDPTSVDAVSGACMLVKSGLFQQLGGFRSDYFMYAEDIDLCYRARKHGHMIYHVPKAEVVHFGGSSSSQQTSAWSIVMSRVALETYMRLNYGEFSALMYKVLQGASATVRLGILVSVLPCALVSSKKVGMKRSTRKWWNVLLWSLGARRVPEISHRKNDGTGIV